MLVLLHPMLQASFKSENPAKVTDLYDMTQTPRKTLSKYKFSMHLKIRLLKHWADMTIEHPNTKVYENATWNYSSCFDYITTTQVATYKYRRSIEIKYRSAPRIFLQLCSGFFQISHSVHTLWLKCNVSQGVSPGLQHSINNTDQHRIQAHSHHYIKLSVTLD